ncbi:bacteriohemerythrin [Geothrix sp. PMB-07]|uniref:bacteriohemerythrin n=1 Tax=Geothrix sp. PMB-07 TaxID=3068640 RepID=UPI002741BB29|nr:bacteriohemerythrin [Geothrix sp. PMB-07]WLT30065.1 bacteriohemerythrin [Geothrix sp. PMB-07]
MPMALWSHQFETGIELIDAQHQMLFDSLNQLDAAVLDGSSARKVEEGLAVIARQSIRHFQSEETFMKELEYPARIRHSEEHHQLILQVRTIQYLQAKGEPVTAEVTEFLTDWFDHHIKEADMDYVRYVKVPSLSR